MTTAIYPGTFDPVTSGHIDVAERAARLFDRLIVAVAVGHHKVPELGVEARVARAREALQHVPNVESTGWRAQTYIRADPALAPGYERLIRGWLVYGNLPWVVMGLGSLGDLLGHPATEASHWMNSRIQRTPR